MPEFGAPPGIDHSKWVRNVRDYGAVGDGVADDTAAVTAAVTGAGAGAMIYFPVGTYLFTVNTTYSHTVWLGTSGITLSGNGSGSVLKLVATAPIGTRILSAAAADITIHDLTFEVGTAIADAHAIAVHGSGSGLLVTSCIFRNPGSGAIRLTGGCSNVQFVHNTVKGGRYGVLSESTSTLQDVIIANNLFDGEGAIGDGVEIDTPNGLATNVVISGYISRGWASGSPNRGLGIGVAHGEGIAITGNTVEDCALSGIHVEDSSCEVSITGNTVRHCGRQGIQVSGVNDTLPLQGAVVVGNTVHGCSTVTGSGGIVLVATDGTNYNLLAGIMVQGNTVRGCGRPEATVYGIDLQYSLRDSIVSSNIVSTTVGQNSGGIRLAQSSGCTVALNRCFDDQEVKTQQYGITISGDQTNTAILDNQFAGNLIAPLDETGLGRQTNYSTRLLE